MFDPAKAEQIIEHIQGGNTLASILPEIGVPRTTLHDWREANPEFADKFARAKDAGEDAIADSIIEIADDGRNDWMERNAPGDSGWVANGEHIQRSKLRVEARLKLLAKWNPKKYGERAQVELTGANGEPLHGRPRELQLTRDELEMIIRERRAKAAALEHDPQPAKQLERKP